MERKTRSFSDVRSYSREKTKRIDEVFGLFDFGKAKGRFMTFRILDTAIEPFVSIAQIWLTKTIVKEGKNKEVRYPRLACNWDPINGEFTSDDKDPFMRLGKEIAGFNAPFYVQAICRELQERKKKWPTATGKKAYFSHDADVEASKQKTPVRVLALPAGVVADLGNKFKQLNTVVIKGKKEERDLTDKKYGRDVSILYDPDAAGGKKYSIQVGDRTPLTEEELSYLKWDLVGLTQEHFTQKQTYDEALAEMKREFGDSESADDYIDDDEDDENLGKKKSKKVKGKTKPEKGKVSKKAKPSADDFDLGDDDDEPKAKKSKVKEKPSKLKPKTKVKAKAGKVSKKSKNDDDELPF